MVSCAELGLILFVQLGEQIKDKNSIVVVQKSIKVLVQRKLVLHTIVFKDDFSGLFGLLRPEKWD